MIQQVKQEWSLLIYYSKDPISILNEKTDIIDIISIQSGSEDYSKFGKFYYIDVHIKCEKRENINKWLEKAGKYQIQLSKIRKIK